MAAIHHSQTTFEDLEIFPTGEIPIIDKFMHEQGIPRSHWLLGTRWKPSDIDEIENIASASLKELDILYRNVFRLSTYPDTGLRFGRALNLSRWGILGTALVSAKDLRDALLTQRRFLPLIHSRFVMDYEVTSEDVIISASHASTWPLPISKQQSFELLAASFCSHFSDLLYQPFFFKKIEFPYPQPAYIESYHRHCAESAVFDSPQMKLWVPIGVFETPLRLSNPVAFKQAVDICEAELQQILDYQTNDTSQIVKRALAKCNTVFPKLEEMAEQLNVSPRTLKRRLNQSGTTYRALVREIQLEMAQTLLTDDSLAINDISTQCGFKNSSGLRDAFKNKLGITPSEYQKNLLISSKNQQVD